MNDILGIALSRDLIHAVVRGGGNANVMSVARSPLLVGSAMRSDDLLVLFRDQHLHIAVVQQGARVAL